MATEDVLPSVTPPIQAKLESILKTRRLLSNLRQRSHSVERRRRISNDEFLDTYYAANQPVIFFDLFTEYVRKDCWRPEQLIATLGNEVVEVMADRQNDPLYERNYDAHRRTFGFAEYVNLVFQARSSNDFYLVANNHLLKRPRFASLLDDLPWPSFLDGRLREDRSFFWLGPAGTVTPLHHDDCNILLTQVRGRKAVKLISPDYTPCLYNRVGCFSDVDADNPDLGKFPRFSEAATFDVVLHPGEALFIPVLWWHHVRALDVSISLSFSNFIYNNNFDIARPDSVGEISV